LDIRVAYSFALVGLLIVASPAKPEIWHYRVDIKPRAPSAGSSAIMRCAENVICRSDLDLIIDGRRKPVTVTILVAPDNAYIRFSATDKPLLIGQEMYFDIPLGITRRASTSVTVNEPRPEALADRESRLLVRPVERSPLAYGPTVDIEVWPDD
jgi:hypothetical protein